MLRQKFLHQCLQVRKLGGGWKQYFFFRRKVNDDFTFKLLLDLSLPGFEIDFARPDGAIKPYAQRQRMLVLA